MLLFVHYVQSNNLLNTANHDLEFKTGNTGASDITCQYMYAYNVYSNNCKFNLNLDNLILKYLLFYSTAALKCLSFHL